MINSREHSSHSFSAPSNFPIFTFSPSTLPQTRTRCHLENAGDGGRNNFLLSFWVYFSFLWRRDEYCALDWPFIHPIWETEINEKPSVLLILTTFALTPWALSFTRGRNWRIGGVAAKQNLIAKPIPLFYITVDAHYSQRQSAFCHCFCGSLNFSVSFIIRAKLAGSCPTIEMYLSDKTFVMAALLI